MKSLVVRCALWLLDGFEVSARNEAIAGDLVEELRAGRSVGWLLREVAVAVGRLVAGDILQHPFLVARAIAVGLGVVVPLRIAREQFGAYGIGAGPAGFWLLTLLAFVLAGWLVAQTHRARKAAMVLAFVLYAAVAKACLAITHYDHYWSPQDPAQAVIDLLLMGLCLVGALLGGMLPGTRSRTMA